MKQYKGYYIDNAVFHNTTEIDEHIKATSIQAYMAAVQAFCDHPDMEHSIFADQKAEYLNSQLGMDWEEIAEIELRAMRAN